MPDVEQDYQAFLKALAKRIKQLRNERGLTLRDMVIKYGYHDSQWRRMEREGVGGVQSLLKIAMVFDISLSTLFDELGSYPKRSLAQINKEGSKPTRRNRADAKAGS